MSAISGLSLGAPRRNTSTIALTWYLAAITSLQSNAAIVLRLQHDAGNRKPFNVSDQRAAHSAHV